MNKPDIIDVLTNLNKELENNPLLEFVAMIKIANNKIKRERQKTKESNILSEVQINKLLSLYNNLKNYLSTNDSVIKILSSKDMEPVFKQCGIKKIEDLDDKVNRIRYNKQNLNINEFNNVYECIEKTFDSLQQVVNQIITNTSNPVPAPVLPALIPAPVPVPIPAPVPVPIPAPVPVPVPVPVPAPVLPVPAPPAPVPVPVPAPVLPAPAPPAPVPVPVPVPVPDPKDAQCSKIDENYATMVTHTPDDLMNKLNDNIKQLGYCFIKQIPKITENLFIYLRTNWQFKNNGLFGFVADTDFTLNELDNYMKDVNKPIIKSNNTQVKLLCLYMKILIEISKYINIVRGISILHFKSLNVFEKLMNFLGDTKRVGEIGTKYNGKSYKQAIDAKSSNMKIKKSNLATGSTYVLSGGAIINNDNDNNNNDMYYEKYIKYKAKYMKLRSKEL